MYALKFKKWQMYNVFFLSNEELKEDNNVAEKEQSKDWSCRKDSSSCTLSLNEHWYYFT